MLEKKINHGRTFDLVLISLMNVPGPFRLDKLCLVFRSQRNTGLQSTHGIDEPSIAIGGIVFLFS